MSDTIKLPEGFEFTNTLEEEQVDEVVKDKDLKLVINSLKKINCKGLNITIPHKQKIFDLCSEVSPIANKLKAINTLKINDNFRCLTRSLKF